MSNIKILDCTLRDGGYVNNWIFGEETIKYIINELNLSCCDYIECGILKNCIYDVNKTLFSRFNQLESLLPKQSKSQYVLLVNYGEIPIKNINIENQNKNINIKVTFKKNQVKNALEFSKQLVEKGHQIFINPMNTISYSEGELIDLISEVNRIKPIGFSIVDTTGQMMPTDIQKLCTIIERNLDKYIKLCFHSHNNLQLSFANSITFISQKTERDIIIDSSVYGMGRGAGNLCTELLMKYINDNYNGYYKLPNILKIIDEKINKIYSETPWGYNVPYYISASLNCHPNYAKYLKCQQNIKMEKMFEILNKIPAEKRGIYDEQVVKNLCL